MNFRIKQEEGFYFAEYRYWGVWLFLKGSYSKNIEDTREACKRFAKYPKGIVESFKL